MNANNGTCLVHVFTLARSCVFLSGQCRFMAENGFRVHVISSPGEQLDRLCAEDGAIGHTLSMNRVISPLEDAVALWRLYLLFRRLRPDIVHGHTPKASLLSAIAARLARVPVYVHHLHGLRHTTKVGLESLLVSGSEYVTCKLSKRVYCVSGSLMDQTVKEKLCSKKKARVLLKGSINGIDAETKFNPARYSSGRAQVREELGIPSSSRVIGYVGRIARDKGIEDLLRGWRKIQAACPDTALVILGGLDDSDPPSDATLCSLGQDANVRLVGETDEVEKYLSIIEVLLFPTHREGFGLVAAESNAMEIPVVAFSVTGCVDAIVDGRTGILVPLGDSDALADAVLAYLRDESLRREHGRNGRIRVIQDFDRHRLWHVLRDEYFDILRLPSSCARSTAES